MLDFKKALTLLVAQLMIQGLLLCFVSESLKQSFLQVWLLPTAKAWCLWASVECLGVQPELSTWLLGTGRFLITCEP